MRIIENRKLWGKEAHWVQVIVENENKEEEPGGGRGRKRAILRSRAPDWTDDQVSHLWHNSAGTRICQTQSIPLLHLTAGLRHMTILGLMPISFKLLLMGRMQPNLDGFVTYDMKLLKWENRCTAKSTSLQPPIICCHVDSTVRSCESVRSVIKILLQQVGGSLGIFWLRSSSTSLSTDPSSPTGLLAAGNCKLLWS